MFLLSQIYMGRCKASVHKCHKYFSIELTGIYAKISPVRIWCFYDTDRLAEDESSWFKKRVYIIFPEPENAIFIHLLFI